MWRTVIVYGLVLAVGVVVLQLLEVQMLARSYPMELYVGLIAAGFMALGVWLGVRIARKRNPTDPFARNDQAIRSMGMSPRELEVLELLAAGKSNKEIAGKLSVSPNTVKTHVARLYEKLEANRRTEAVMRARELGVIP